MKLQNQITAFRLREFACELTSSLPPAREDGRSREAIRGRDPGDLWDPGMGSFFQCSIVKIGTLRFLPSPLCGEMGGRGLKHCKTQYFWHLDFRRGFSGAQEAQAASQLLSVWVHYLGSMLPLGVCSTTLGSMFNYPGEYFQLPWGVCSSTLGGMFK